MSILDLACDPSFLKRDSDPIQLFNAVYSDCYTGEASEPFQDHLALQDRLWERLGSPSLSRREDAAANEALQSR